MLMMRARKTDSDNKYASLRDTATQIAGKEGLLGLFPRGSERRSSKAFSRRRCCK